MVPTVKAKELEMADVGSAVVRTACSVVTVFSNALQEVNVRECSALFGSAVVGGGAVLQWTLHGGFSGENSINTNAASPTSARPPTPPPFRIVLAVSASSAITYSEPQKPAAFRTMMLAISELFERKTIPVFELDDAFSDNLNL